MHTVVIEHMFGVRAKKPVNQVKRTSTYISSSESDRKLFLSSSLAPRSLPFSFKESPPPPPLLLSPPSPSSFLSSSILVKLAPPESFFTFLPKTPFLFFTPHPPSAPLVPPPEVVTAATVDPVAPAEALSKLSALSPLLNELPAEARVFDDDEAPRFCADFFFNPNSERFGCWSWLLFVLPVDGVGAGAGGGGGGDEAVEVSASGIVVVDIGIAVKVPFSISF
ncbi:hypothetical protein B9Z19DRAFT_752110 [Tuber borchii]|uniref:Uncharacterized protein n=1 Tax=Tuber borchii TaxID=42251 RepID=A0A2T7A7R4_TUBBO|nr:hypothetical protein B9Z19DRAFT_752110 [Tuber borchii]